MTGVLDAILAVFSSIGEWIANAVTDLIPMFYTAGDGGGLTFIGVLAVSSLGISVIFLIIGVNCWIAPTLLSRYHGGTHMCANEEVLLPVVC